MADKKSRQIIRQAKSHNENSIVVATGCYAEVSKAELEKVEELDIIAVSYTHLDVYKRQPLLS